MNWGSYVRDIGVLGAPFSYFVPNIAFLRMLRFLKPLGRVRVLFPSKVVVKTVAASMQSMGPVLSLVFFAMFFFGVMGIYVFGKNGVLYYRCGIALEPSKALSYYDPSTYQFSVDQGMQVVNCTIDMDRYREFLRLRGKWGDRALLGQGAPQPGPEQPPSHFREVIDAMASDDSGAGSNPYPDAVGRQLLGLARWDRELGAIDHPLEVPYLVEKNETTGEYVTEMATFSIKQKQDDCSAKDPELYYVNGVEMNADQFGMTKEFAGRYMWLGQPFKQGGERRRRRVKDQARRSDESSANISMSKESSANISAKEEIGAKSVDSPTEHGEDGNFIEATCIVAQPPKICRYAASTRTRVLAQERGMSLFVTAGVLVMLLPCTHALFTSVTSPPRVIHLIEEIIALSCVLDICLNTIRVCQRNCVHEDVL